jgi:fibronectin-binding autotransporter adhesin
MSLVQIKRSINTAVPATLSIGELAYSTNGNILFIGDPSTSVVTPIGGIRTPGILTANQALVANSTSGINVLQTANLVLLGTSGSIVANGTTGTVGQVLYTGGAGANNYWSAPANANNATYLNGVLGSLYQLNSTLSANVITLTSNNSTYFGSQLPAYYANVTSPLFSTNIKVGANVTLSTTTLNVISATGNITANDISLQLKDIGSNTSTLGTSNLTILNGPSADYISVGPTAVSLQDKLVTPTKLGFLGYSMYVSNTAAINVTSNSWANAVILPESIKLNYSAGNSTVNTISTATINTSIINFGNSTVNSTINTTAFSGSSNNATNFAGQSQAFYANVTSPTFSTTASIGANVVVDTAKITFGNSTVNSTISSTTYTGTSNNATNLNGLLGSYYQLNSTLAANVATLTSNNSLYLGGVLSSLYQLNSTLAANVATLVSNNSVYLNGVLGSLYQLNSTLAANVATLTSNNSLYLGGLIASGYQTTAGLSANVITLSANNASFLNGIGAASYVQNTDSRTLSGNLTFSGASVTINNLLTANNGIIRNVAGFGSAYWLTTDGTGRQHWYWNTAGGATPTFIAGGEDISAISLNYTGNNAGGSFFHRSAAGAGVLAGANATLTTTLYTDINTLSWKGTAIAVANGSAYNLVANNATYLNGLLGSLYQLNSTLSANVATLTSNNATNLNGVLGSLYQLNSTLSANVATLTSNNATNLGGNPSSYYANISSPIFTTTASVGANVVVDTAKITFGNSTVNTTINATTYTGTANNATNLGGVLSSLYQLNSTLAANVATLVSNNATNFGGQLPTFYANVSAPTFTTNIKVGANVILDTATLTFGNSTVNTTVNSTIYQGTSNNATNFGGQLPVFYANVSAPTFTTNIKVGANVVVDTAKITFGNATIFSTINVSNYTGSANNASFLNGIGAASYVQNTDSRTLSGNLTLAGANLYITGTNTYIGTNTTIVGTNTVISSNVIINGSIISAPTANLTVLNAVISGNLTIGGSFVSINSSQLVVNDNFIELAYNNATTDAVDTGIFAPAGNLTSIWYSGIARVAAQSTNNNPLFWIFSSNTNPNTALIVDQTSNSSTGTLKSYLAPYGAGGLFIVNSTSISISGNTTVPVIVGANNLTISTPLATTSGGLGLNTVLNNGLLVGNTGNAYTPLALGATGLILQSNGTALIYGSIDGGIF